MGTITKENRGDSQVTKISSAIVIAVPYRKAERKSMYMFLKRAIDIIVGLLILIVVLSWLFPLLAILIGLSSKGGVLFIQKRIGKNGKIFRCYKFRTMVINEDADVAEARLNDKRITGIGKWLRRTYIDELPQIINVLAGDMSIVGPRPHMLYHHRKFCAELTNYNYRHQVRPGITGLSQVKGYHGAMFDPYLLRGRTKLDLFYVENVSFKMDMMILMKTLLIFSANKKER